jgi:hypothetical protein
MRRRIAILALGVLAIAAWQLMRSLDDPPPQATVVAQPAPMRANEAARMPVEPPADMFATVRGAVRDQAGKAIANARVCASLDRCTSTAATGTYELVGVPTTASKVAAAAPRFQPRVAWIAGLTDGEVRTVDLVLDSGGVRVHGRVLDLRGQAIAGAIITEAVTEGIDITTRADGAFELWVARGMVRLVASAGGYASSGRRVDPPAQIDFALDPESTIAGIVVDEKGAPVAGARVVIRDGDEDVARQRAVTADDGTFRLVGLPPGSYELRAQTFGLAGQAPVTVGTGEQLTGVTIRVGEAFQVGVHVKHADGTACPEATVSLSAHDDRRGGHVGIARKQPGGSVIDAVPAGMYVVSIGCPPAVSAETLDVKDDVDVTYTVEDPRLTGVLRVSVEAPGRIPGEGDGLFLAVRSQSGQLRSVAVPGHGVVVESVPPGVYRVRLVSTSNGGTEEVVTVRAGETTDKVMRIAPPTMGRLRATAMDEEGRTLTDVALAITGPKVERTMRTLSDGSVTMYLPAGDYDISHAGSSVPAHVTSGASREVRLTVPPTAIVRGTVVDSSDRPVPDAIVARVNPQGFSDQARVDARPVDASGAFRFPVMSDAPITLVATRIGGGESPSVQTDGKSPVKLVIGGGATLSGSIVSADGKRVPRFTVTISNVTRNLDLGERPFANGAFTWSNLGPGEHRVVIESRQLVVRDKVTIAADARTATIAMTLPRTVTLTGRVVDAVSREPIPNAKVHIQHETNETAVGGTVGRIDDARTTDTTGRFSFDHVVAASYQLEVIAGAQHLATSQTVNVTGTNIDLAEIAVARARR